MIDKNFDFFPILINTIARSIPSDEVTTGMALNFLVQIRKSPEYAEYHAIISSFMANLSKGNDYQFDLKSLRNLRPSMRWLCIIILIADFKKEWDDISTWGFFSPDELSRWIKEDGIRRTVGNDCDSQEPRFG